MSESALTQNKSDGTAQRAPEDRFSAKRVWAEVEAHVLRDGLRLVVDLERSRGRRLVDGLTGRKFLDFYGGHGSMALGFNHPWFERAEVKAELELAARTKLANPDVCSAPFSRFVSAFSRVLGLAPLERYFLIEGGALAVENALKAAMDWKVRKNLASGYGPMGTEILHFERAFHGRSGYTLSLTNTDPIKTDYFAKFDWPRVPAPWLDFSLSEPKRTRVAEEKEHSAERRIRDILDAHGRDIAGIIIEPIQSEGGDNHFRGEWLQTLRHLCDEHEVLLIFDEVQTGAGATGRRWCCEHFDVVPDLLAFGKKVQVCGVMAGPRLDEVPENCFRLSGRISSTWGGNSTDMARAAHLLRVIEEEHLIENAESVGALLVAGLCDLAGKHKQISAPRGRGLLIAFDLPSPAERDAFFSGLFELGLLALKCGPRSIRFRPALDVTAEEAREALALIGEQCRR